MLEWWLSSYYEKLADGRIRCINDEIPFEIPRGWEWARLKAIVYNHGQLTPTQSFSYIDIGSINNKDLCLKEKENIVEAKEAPSRARRIVEKEDILYSTVRPYLHNMCIVDRDFTAIPIASTGLAVMACHKGLNNKFLFLYMQSPQFDLYANDGDNAKGVAYPAINDEKLYNALIPIPPVEEQDKICVFFDELLPYLRKYDYSQSQLDALNKSIKVKLKKSILQEAIQGRLVPKDSNEEPASSLLERISAEKLKLLNEGKLKKKDIVDSVIFKGEDNKYYEKLGDRILELDDEIPFDIPESWKWERLGHLFAHNTGKALNHGSSKGVSHKYLTTSNVYWNHFDFSDVRSMPFTDEELEKCTVKNGDLLVCEGGDVGRAAIWPYDYDICIQNHIHRLRAYYPLCTPFYYYVLKLYKGIGKIGSKGIGIQGLSSGALHNIIVPVPPIGEQERIVLKVTELLGLL